MKVERTKLNRIYVGDDYLAAIGKYLQDKQGNAAYVNLLTKKRFTIKDTDSSYRTINHWSSIGLLDDARSDDNKGWRKFSVVDMAWLRVLMEMRRFGLSLDKIKVGYSSLSGKNKQLLECGIVLCMMRKGINLVVFSDGYIEVVPRDSIAISESMGYLKDAAYLMISLNNCLEKIFPGKNYSPEFDTFSLSEKEISVLSEMRCGGFDEVSVQMKSGDIHRIDTKTKHVGEIGKLSDLLGKAPYGDFSIKNVDGKIAFVEIVKKTKV